MIIENPNLNCARKIIVIIACYYSVLSYGLDEEKYTHKQIVSFTEAKISLEILSDWRYEPPDNVSSPEVLIKIRRTLKDEYKNFAHKLERIESYKDFKAKNTKENQYYWLLKESDFETKSGVHGKKSIYGYKENNPSAISYYFINDAEEFIEVNLKFREWNTIDIWQEIDKLILNGLSLIVL